MHIGVTLTSRCSRFIGPATPTEGTEHLTAQYNKPTNVDRTESVSERVGTAVSGRGQQCLAVVWGQQCLAVV